MAVTLLRSVPQCTGGEGQRGTASLVLLGVITLLRRTGNHGERVAFFAPLMVLLTPWRC